MKLRLTEPAERDIRDILQDTLKMFGPRQVVAYARIIEEGLALLAEEPARPASRTRDELAPGVRMFHLEFAGGRRGSAAHCIYYRVEALPGGTKSVAVLRVLHERMEPGHRLVGLADPSAKSQE